MERKMLIIIGGMLLSGCAASHQPVACTCLPDSGHTAAPAATLAFDPQMGPHGAPAPQFARDDRDIRAFGGFQGESTELYDIQTDDDFQVDNFPTTYERRVLSDKIGVISR